MSVPERTPNYVSPDRFGQSINFVTEFTPDRIQNMLSILPDDEMVLAMHKANPHIDETKLQSLVHGESGRLLNVAYQHGPVYGETIWILQKLGIVPSSYSAVELGAALGAHMAIMDKTRQPAAYTGIDNQPHIVAGAAIAMKAWKSLTIVPDEYRIIQGDHTTKLPKADVEFQVLVTQYEGGAVGSVKHGEKHADTTIISDVAHQSFPFDTSQLKPGGIIPMEAPRLPDAHTGLAWQILGPAIPTPFGDVYKVSLRYDRNVFDDERLTMFRLSQDTYEGYVTVKPEGLMNWAFIPTAEAGGDDINEMIGFQKTMSDIYTKIGNATNGEHVWHAMDIAAVPAIAAKENLYGAMSFSTAEGSNHPASILPLAIILRHAQEIGILASKPGLLSAIGHGKQFPDATTLLQRALYWIRNPQEHARKFEYHNPPVVTFVQVKDADAFALLRNLSK